ncbi:MAG TPA: hypothetical protein VFZ57_12580, partial [Thermoanaerobaculia bacterium]|nr:hypothetical protein [Thermoanaerobaculia bacterium]
APEAFRRGLSAVVANPGLILAPLAFAASVLAVIAAPVLVLLVSFARLHRGFRGMSALSRDPAMLLTPLVNLVEGMLAAPFLLLGGLFVLLVLLLFLTAFAAWIRAGVTGSLLAIDARADDDSPLAAFRHPALGSVFRVSARRLYGRFFALVNLYGLALSFLVLLLLLPIGLAVLAATSERGGLVVAAFAFFLLILPLTIGGAVALRVLYLVACRLAASEDVDSLEAVARAASWTRASLSRVSLLYLLSLAAGFVAGFAFLVPRFALSLVAGRSLVLFLTGTGVLVLAQMFLSLSYDLAVTGAFVALWPARGGGGVPPVAYAPAEEAPRLV